MNEIKLEDLDVISLNHVNSHSKDNDYTTDCTDTPIKIKETNFLQKSFFKDKEKIKEKELEKKTSQKTNCNNNNSEKQYDSNSYEKEILVNKINEDLDIFGLPNKRILETDIICDSIVNKKTANFNKTDDNINNEKELSENKTKNFNNRNKFDYNKDDSSLEFTIIDVKNNEILSEIKDSNIINEENFLPELGKKSNLSILKKFDNKMLLKQSSHFSHMSANSNKYSEYTFQNPNISTNNGKVDKESSGRASILENNQDSSNINVINNRFNMFFNNNNNLLLDEDFVSKKIIIIENINGDFIVDNKITIDPHGLSVVNSINKDGSYNFGIQSYDVR